MSDDIVARPRQTSADMLGTPDEPHYHDCHEAADEITRLRTDLAVARALLKAIRAASPQANMTPLLARIDALLKGDDRE